MSEIVQDALRRPLASLRVSVTDRCNMRCRYCMPEDEYVWLPRASILTVRGSSVTNDYMGHEIEFDRSAIVGKNVLDRREPE